MKSIVIDTGPVISLTMNNLLWLLEPLKKRFNGNFYITKTARQELVEKPLNTKRFEFEALQTLQYFENNTITIVDNKEIDDIASALLGLANNAFSAKGRSLTIVHQADIEGVAAARYLHADAFVIDERTTRMMVEQPEALQDILEKKLRTTIQVDHQKLHDFAKETKDIRIIRSAELVFAAYKLGLLDKYLPTMPHAKKRLLDAVLWGVKLDGCAISKKEILTVLRSEKP